MGDASDVFDDGTGTAITVEVRAVGFCDVGSGSGVLDADVSGEVGSGEIVRVRDGLGDSDSDADADSEADSDSDSDWSGPSTDRVGLGSVRVADGDAVSDGRSPDPSPSPPPQADRMLSARRHRTAQRAAR
ncbi:MAG: hypothetical protein ABWY19_07635 [Marmoricola sp.]